MNRGLAVCLAMASTLWTCTILIAIVASGCAPLMVALPPPQRAGTAGLDWLSADGSVIVDTQGRKVLLRGFNTASLLEWPRQPIAPLDETDLELMRRAGFSVVRLPIAWSRLEAQRGSIDREYLDEVETTVRRINAHGMYVVLNIHVSLAWSPRFGGAGAPSWAAVPAIPHLPVAAAGEWTEMLSPAVVAATDYFWLNPDWQTDLALTWRAVAERFRDNSGVVGYDLFNEPTAVIPPIYFDRWLVWPLYARLIAEIGRVDANHLFFIEAPYVAELRPSIRPLLADARVVFSPHLYTGSQVAPLFADEPEGTPRRIHEQAAEAAEVPAAAWWGELGIVMDKPYAASWADAALDTFDDLQVGWAWWQWRQDWNWGVRNGDGDFVNRAFLTHLARPYVAAAPTGVHPGRGSAVEGTLHLLVDAQHDDAEVVVAWPALVLAAPSVTGSCVASSSWSPSSARLRVVLVHGEGCGVRVGGPAAPS